MSVRLDHSAQRVPVARRIRVRPRIAGIAAEAYECLKSVAIAGMAH